MSFFKNDGQTFFIYFFRDLFVSKKIWKRPNYWWGRFHENLSTCQLCVVPYFFFYHTHWRIIEEARAAPPVKRPCQNKLLPLLLLTYTCEWGMQSGRDDVLNLTGSSALPPPPLSPSSFLCDNGHFFFLFFIFILSFQLSPVKRRRFKKKKMYFLFFLK